MRLGPANGVEHEVAAIDLRNDFDVRFEREQARERAADHRLILCDEDPDHVERGTVTRNVNPPSGLAIASSRPRTRSAR